MISSIFQTRNRHKKNQAESALDLTTIAHPLILHAQRPSCIRLHRHVFLLYMKRIFPPLPLNSIRATMSTNTALCSRSGSLVYLLTSSFPIVSSENPAVSTSIVPLSISSLNMQEKFLIMDDGTQDDQSSGPCFR